MGTSPRRPPVHLSELPNGQGREDATVRGSRITKLHRET